MSNSLPLPTNHEEIDKLANDPTGSICWICNQFEIFDGEPYLICFECGHVYQTPEQLVQEYERDVDWSWEGSADQILFCPNCLHDF